MFRLLPTGCQGGSEMEKHPPITHGSNNQQVCKVEHPVQPLVLPLFLTTQGNTFLNGSVQWPHCHSLLMMDGITVMKPMTLAWRSQWERAIPEGESTTIDIGDSFTLVWLCMAHSSILTCVSCVLALCLWQ